MSKITKAAMKEYRYAGGSLEKFKASFDENTRQLVDWSVFA